MPPTLGNPTHNGFHSALQCTMDKTSWVYPTSPLCKIHMSDVQFHMPIMQFMKTIILECAEYRPLCPFHYSAYSIIHNQYHSSLVSLRVAWEKGTSFPGETISVGEFFFGNVWLKSSSGNVVQIKLFLYKWKALKCRYVKWFRLWMKSYDQKKLKIKFSNTPFSFAIGSSSTHGRKTFESLTSAFLFVITFSS